MKFAQPDSSAAILPEKPRFVTHAIASCGCPRDGHDRWAYAPNGLKAETFPDFSPQRAQRTQRPDRASTDRLCRTVLIAGDRKDPLRVPCQKEWVSGSESFHSRPALRSPCLCGEILPCTRLAFGRPLGRLGLAGCGGRGFGRCGRGLARLGMRVTKHLSRGLPRGLYLHQLARAAQGRRGPVS
jgi:hypothetical protein